MANAEFYARKYIENFPCNASENMGRRNRHIAYVKLYFRSNSYTSYKPFKLSVETVNALIAVPAVMKKSFSLIVFINMMFE